VASKTLDECELSVSSPTPKCVVDVWKRELAAAQRIIAEQADELWRLSEALRVSETAQAAMRDTMGAMAESAESVAESAAASASVDESTRTEIADTERELATARAEVVAAEDELNLRAVRSAEDLESDKRAMDVAMKSAQDELNAVNSGAAVSRRELAASLATTNVELASLNVLRRDPTQLAEATEVEAAEATRESFVYGSVRYWRRQRLLRPIWLCARNGRALPTRQGHCHVARDFAKAIVAGSNRRPMRDTIFTSVLAIVFLGVAVAINTYTIDARQQEGVWHFVLRVIERQVGVVCGSGSGSSGSGLFDDESHLFAATCGTDTSTMEDYLACFEDAIHAIERNVRALSVADARMCACKDSISSFGEWQQCVSSTAGVLLETFSNSYFTITHAPAPHFKCSLTE
jgi:hypothetical protein